MTTERDQYFAALKAKFPDHDAPEVQIMTMEFENTHSEQWCIMIEPWANADYQSKDEIWTLVTGSRIKDGCYFGEAIYVYDEQVSFYGHIATTVFDEKDTAVVNDWGMNKREFYEYLQKNDNGLISEQVRVIFLIWRFDEIIHNLKLPQKNDALALQIDTDYVLITTANSLQSIMRLRRVEDGSEIVSEREVAIFDMEGKRLA